MLAALAEALNVAIEDLLDEVYLRCRHLSLAPWTLGLLIRGKATDNGLWFWDMYAERSDGLDEDGSYALLLAMSNEVHTDCPHHLDRLPSQLLGD